MNYNDLQYAYLYRFVISYEKNTELISVTSSYRLGNRTHKDLSILKII